jgi:hypothetical protein
MTETAIPTTYNVDKITITLTNAIVMGSIILYNNINYLYYIII